MDFPYPVERPFHPSGKLNKNLGYTIKCSIKTSVVVVVVLLLLLSLLMCSEDKRCAS